MPKRLSIRIIVKILDFNKTERKLAMYSIDESQRHCCLYIIKLEGCHVVSLKEVSGRFSSHFKEIYEKFIEYTRKFFMQIRVCLKFGNNDLLVKKRWYRKETA